MNRPSMSSSLRFLLLATLAGSMLCVAGASTTLASAYRIKMHNGNEFLSAYKPVHAEWDPSKLLLLTEQGNLIALDDADIAEVVHDLEVQGFGRVIDTTTIEVGYSANMTNQELGPDGELPPGVEQLQQMQRTMAMERMLTPPPQNFTTPQFAEPNSGGGIPVGFVNTVTPPLGGVNN